MNSKKLVQISLFSKCKFLKHDWDRLIHLIYPRRCPVCGKIVGSSPGKPVQYVHSGCLGKLKWVCEPCCLKCGKPVASPVQAYCFDCTRRPKSFDGGISVWVYTKEMSVSIAGFKYHGRQAYGDFYVQSILLRHGTWIRSHAIDCITAVPLNYLKLQKRGYNQAGILAKRLGRALNIPVDLQLLVRNRYTKSQKELSPRERMENLKKAFEPGKNAGQYRTVLIVDDIYTTGSTMEICSSILKSRGTQRVYILSLCIGSDC